jgi:hypothetical protein
MNTMCIGRPDREEDTVNNSVCQRTHSHPHTLCVVQHRYLYRTAKPCHGCDRHNVRLSSCRLKECLECLDGCNQFGSPPLVKSPCFLARVVQICAVALAGCQPSVVLCRLMHLDLLSVTRATVPADIAAACLPTVPTAQAAGGQLSVMMVAQCGPGALQKRMTANVVAAFYE